ncbi:uncharacterized protein JN550_011561 [Neoarthrinium moseri]|uniref:uncharacterized protein n=1 Tax=Neoarthrinium moseri TaxID=1658444 RepID=UPI001FDCF7A3|nr:uncharacterized protein JN550_011561 [Neoarthrinium moseri]KAI1860295.1 hypothetical protein JN550_011561 [Neoarthrinium moseri]
MSPYTPTSIQTTLPSTPLPPNSQRQPIATQRLVVRPLQQDDLEAFHILRTQREAMTGTRLGRPDRNMQETQEALDYFLTPNDAEVFLFGAFLDGELIGEGGVHTLESSGCGWPEIGYKLKKEHWNKGYVTELLQTVLKAWWKLPRCKVEIKVHLQSVDAGNPHAEYVYANTEIDNLASQRVLQKLGFERFSEWTEPDTQEHRLGEPVTLVGYKLLQKLMT